MTQMEGHDGSTIVTMYRPKKLQVRVDTRFEDVRKVSLGQPVEIDNPALQSPLTGKVLFISSEADIQKNTLQVKVEIPDPPEVFKPEMLVDVTFLQGQDARDKERALKAESKVVRLFVPPNLVQSGGEETYVWVADQSQQVARRQSIETGPTSVNGLIEVIEGLNVSSRLISSGVDSLTEGCRIRITGEDTTVGTAFLP